MKRSFTKITSSLLALLVLLSTLSFTVESHYCGDFLVDVSYVGQADGCGMEKSSSINEFKKDQSIKLLYSNKNIVDNATEISIEI